MIRAAFGIVFLGIWSSACFAQVPTEADERAQQVLVASTWSGEVRGFRMSGYLLDEGLVILKLGDEKPREGHWTIRAGKFQLQTRLSMEVNLSLNAEIRGDVMAGTAEESNVVPLPLEQRKDLRSSFELRRDPKPNPELLAATPQNRPFPPAPRANPREFDGVYEMDLPEKIGEKSPLVKNRLTCKDGKCTFSVGEADEEIYDKLGVIRPFHFAQARFALKHAMDRKHDAKEEAPYLAPLLDSGANLRACIDLGISRMYAPGMIILCKVDRNPWKRRAVLLMGRIISDRCTAFCRYGIVPLLQRQ